MTSRTVLFVVAHHDDWQLFAGKAALENLRDPQCRVVVVVTTAGDAGDEPYHWQSRLNGGVLSLMRGLDAFSPYDLGRTRAPALPLRVTVEFAQMDLASKAVLRAEIRDGDEARAALYALHLPDGGSGTGFAPAFESLERLHAGCPATTLWPEPGSRYASWTEFEDVIAAIVARERGSEAIVPVYAASIDGAVNPGDHSDHRFTSLAVQSLARRDDALRPIWFTTYANASRDPNLDARGTSMQRALIHAYAGGYMAAASELTANLRTGWQREYAAFEGRQYTDADHHDRSNAM